MAVCLAIANGARASSPALHNLPVRLPQKAHAASPAANFNLTVSPATVSFTATNPVSAPTDAGSSAATVSWSNLDFNSGSWNLTVQASSTAFTSCATVPISAVTVSCSSVSATIGGTGSCAAPFKLSTSPQVVASGNQGILTYDYSITLSFTLTDSWKYIAETSPSCSLSLSYAANVP